MKKPLFLYSTNTWLAYAIAEQYYNGIHWVWCSPFFRPHDRLESASAMPVSAIPGEIADHLLRDIDSGDMHSHLINRNRIGIARGASAKRQVGVITAEQEAEIQHMAEKAELRDFKPLVFVMAFPKVQHQLVVIPPAERAHPASREYRHERLRRRWFDVLELRRSDHA